MIKNVVFDIGNVILNFNVEKVLKEFTQDTDEQNFIFDNIINSPEWLKNSLIDTGYISREDAIKIVQDRTNHERDFLIEKFWNTYNDYAFVDERMLDLIVKLTQSNYKVYLLSNINPYTHDKINETNLLSLVDGYVFSYKEHMVKPFKGIYNILIERYSIVPSESLFIDDNLNNINTGNEIGFISRLVMQDNFDSVLDVIKEYNLI